MIVSIIESGLSDIYAITSKIEALKNGSTSGAVASNSSAAIDPQNALYELQLNFNDMLMRLVSSDDDKEENSDPFAFLYGDQYTDTTTTTQNETPGTTSNALSINSYTGTIDPSTLT
jgi:hypothetical protein